MTKLCIKSYFWCNADGLSTAISSNFLPWIAVGWLNLAQRECLFRVCLELVRTFSVDISMTPIRHIFIILYSHRTVTGGLTWAGVAITG